MSDTLFPIIEKGAHFSDCRVYRYTLWRFWSNEPYANFICLNPSTADENVDDRTVKKCMTLARNWKMGGICITNIFAYRATDPQEMKKAEHPIGVKNDAWLRTIAKDEEAGIVVAAWSGHANHLDRANQVKKLLKDIPFYYLRKLKGEPWHPLYLPNDTQPIPWTDFR